MAFALNSTSGIDTNKPVLRNLPVAKLYEHALQYEKGTYLSSAGAIITSSGKKTGRSPNDKRIVEEKSTSGDIWWGPSCRLPQHS
ncbi:Protein kinase C-like 1 [Basidiobolus ranarum]|uniref:Phosphoenolpyruvate carboxykinase (ATP) n=1 Tax=Basidiobolus ranarum TaxID=34480 RepID=A0ABR2WCH2_9FUNG